jgi:undecaprenyl diphosphate synthase
MDGLPKHIAIIMDGNRRWARAKGIPIALGHKQGAETLEKITRYANKIGIKYLTVYAFSTENWKRAEDEVKALMLLLQNYIDKYSKIADSENIRVQFLGDLSAFTPKMYKGIQDCINRTKNNTGLVFNIALNYGGRLEITNAIKQIAKDIKDEKFSIEDINENLISDYLYTKGMPDPDLLIRTSGEIRTSNFLPWQLVYSEFVFVEKNWPDFNEKDLDEAIEVYQGRNRKFGGSK